MRSAQDVGGGICSDELHCLTLVMINLLAVMFTKCFGQNVGEMMKPIAMKILKRKVAGGTAGGGGAKKASGGGGAKPRGGLRDGGALSASESQFLMAVYDPVNDSIIDYREIAIIFGYVTLFTVVFPIGPCMALFGFMFEVKVDAFKMLEMQRPMPRGNQDIGSWMLVFKVRVRASTDVSVSVCRVRILQDGSEQRCVRVCRVRISDFRNDDDVTAPVLRRRHELFVGISVITNAAVICFKLNLIGTADALVKTWAFNATQYVLFGLMLAMSLLISDVPKDVKTQLARQEHLRSKCVRRDPDEAEDTNEVDDMDHPIILHDYDEEDHPNPTGDGAGDGGGDGYGHGTSED